MQLYACGLNEHGQASLDTHPEVAVHDFRQIASGKRISVLFAGYRETLICVDGIVHVLGDRGPKQLPLVHLLANLPLSATCFGNHTGILGVSDCLGQVSIMTPIPSMPELSPSLEAPVVLDVPFTHLAVAADGRVAVVIPDPVVPGVVPTSTILDFKSYDGRTWDPFASPAQKLSGSALPNATPPATEAVFLDWLATAQTTYPGPKQDQDIAQPLKHTIRGICSQLVANDSVFSLLTRDAIVYTWTDEENRWQLAQYNEDCSISPAIAVSPGETDWSRQYLAQKLASGKDISIGILSGEFGRVGLCPWGRIYYPRGAGAILYGARCCEENPETAEHGYFDEQELMSICWIHLNSHRITCEDMELGKYDEIINDEEYYPGYNLDDVSVGDGHAALLDEDGVVWTAGRNQCGQLGHGTGYNDFEKFWRRVRGLDRLKEQHGAKAIEVHCGTSTTFVLVGLFK